MTQPARDDQPSIESPQPVGDQDGKTAESAPKEVGGRSRGLDPTRYGDWEKNGRCIDF